LDSGSRKRSCPSCSGGQNTAHAEMKKPEPWRRSADLNGLAALPAQVFYADPAAGQTARRRSN